MYACGFSYATFVSTPVMSEHLDASNSTANAWCANAGDAASSARRQIVIPAVAFIESPSMGRSEDRPLRSSLAVGRWPFVASKIIFDSELQDPRRSGLRRDAAEGAGVEVQHGIAPVEVVEQVERLQPKFEPLRPADGDQLGHREVDVPEIRTDDGIARKVAQGSGYRLRECRAVEIARQRVVVEVVADLVGPLIQDAGECVVDPAEDVQAIPRARVQDSREPPVRRQCANRRAADVRNFVPDRRRRQVPSILVAIPRVERRVVRLEVAAARLIEPWIL